MNSPHGIRARSRSVEGAELEKGSAQEAKVRVQLPDARPEPIRRPQLSFILRRGESAGFQVLPLNIAECDAKWSA